MKKKILILCVIMTLGVATFTGCKKDSAKITSSEIAESDAKTEVTTTGTEAKTEVSQEELDKLAEQARQAANAAAQQVTETPAATPAPTATPKPTPKATPKPTFTPPPNPANVSSNPTTPATTTPSLPTVNTSRPSGYNQSLAAALVSAIDTAKTKVNNKSAFEPYAETTKSVASAMQPFVNKEALDKTVQNLEGFQPTDAKYKYTLFGFNRISFETDQDSEAGIIKVMESNYSNFLKANSTVGVVSVYYDSSIKKNRVVVYSTNFSYVGVNNAPPPGANVTVSQ